MARAFEGRLYQVVFIWGAIKFQKMYTYIPPMIRPWTGKKSPLAETSERKDAIHLIFKEPKQKTYMGGEDTMLFFIPFITQKYEV